MHNVIVFTKEACPQCESTKKLMDKLGIKYSVADLMEHPEVVEKAKKMGIQSAPVVVVDENTWWGGFQRGKIEALVDENTNSVWDE